MIEIKPVHEDNVLTNVKTAEVYCPDCNVACQMSVPDYGVKRAGDTLPQLLGAIWKTVQRKAKSLNCSHIQALAFPWKSDDF